MNLGIIVKVGERALNAVQGSFTPKPNATSKEVRINGAICIGIGFLCIAGYGAAVLIAGPKIFSEIFLLPIMLAYACLVVGGYRLVFGVSAKANPYEVLAWRRVLFGIGWILFLFGLPIALRIYFGP